MIHTSSCLTWVLIATMTHILNYLLQINYNMFLGFLLFSLCASTVKSQLTSSLMTTTTTAAPTTAIKTTMKLGPLHLVATPDYPVAAGQKVQLYCRTVILPQSIIWTRHHLQNQSWENVGRGNLLVLTEPKESGKYRCETQNIGTERRVSQNHTVYIVSISTPGDNLGKAAFALSILILIAIIAGLLWWVWQTFSNKLSALDAPKKDIPPLPKVTPKVLPPTADDDDVYMNYTSTTQDSSDLNPSGMTGDDLYSSLS